MAQSGAYFTSGFHDPTKAKTPRTASTTSPKTDDAGTFFLDREKDTTDAVAGETVVVVGYVIPGDVFIQNEANIKRNNEKSIEDMGRIFNPVVQDVANVGLVVKPIARKGSSYSRNGKMATAFPNA